MIESNLFFDNQSLRKPIQIIVLSMEVSSVVNVFVMNKGKYELLHIPVLNTYTYISMTDYVVLFMYYIYNKQIW